MNNLTLSGRPSGESRSSPTTRRSAAGRAPAGTRRARAPSTSRCRTRSTRRSRRSRRSCRSGSASSRSAAAAAASGAMRGRRRHRPRDRGARADAVLADHRAPRSGRRAAATGGGDGAPGRNTLNGEPLPAKCEGELEPGDVLSDRDSGRRRLRAPGADDRPRRLTARCKTMCESSLICRSGRPALDSRPSDGPHSGPGRVALVRDKRPRLNPDPGRINHANCFQGMVRNRARARRGRAARHPSQGRHPRGEQALRARARAFFLYPTFDHQRNDLVRESHHPELRRALEEGVWPEEEPPPRALLQDGGIPQPDRVRIRAWAEVADHFTTDDPRIVDSLSPYHVWTQDYARKRLRWKRTHPLHVLLLKVHRIPRPVTVRVRDEHIGCHSWVEIDRDLPFEGVPVMADDEFDRAAARDPHDLRRRHRPEPEPALAWSGGGRLDRPRSSPRAGARGAATAATLLLGIGGGGDVVGALTDRARARGSRPTGRGRRSRLGAVRGRPPPRRSATARAPLRDRADRRRRGADRRATGARPRAYGSRRPASPHTWAEPSRSSTSTTARPRSRLRSRPSPTGSSAISSSSSTSAATSSRPARSPACRARSATR